MAIARPLRGGGSRLLVFSRASRTSCPGCAEYACGEMMGLHVAYAHVLNQHDWANSSALRRPRLIKQLKESVLPEIERAERQGANGAVAGIRACTRLFVHVQAAASLPGHACMRQ